MGNCLPFLPFAANNDGDLTRLHNLNERNNEAPDPQRTSGHNRHSRSISSNEDTTSRLRYRRNLHPSSYVNELYVNAAENNGDDESIGNKVIDEKKRARVRGLLEQLNVDRYVKNSKNDEECAICMIDFLPDEPIRYLPCMHLYHVACIDDWLLRSFTCPSCMEPVDSAILSTFTVNCDRTNGNLASLPCSTGQVL